MMNNQNPSSGYPNNTSSSAQYAYHGRAVSSEGLSTISAQGLLSTGSGLDQPSSQHQMASHNQPTQAFSTHPIDHSLELPDYPTLQQLQQLQQQQQLTINLGSNLGSRNNSSLSLGSHSNSSHSLGSQSNTSSISVGQSHGQHPHQSMRNSPISTAISTQNSFLPVSATYRFDQEPGMGGSSSSSAGIPTSTLAAPVSTNCSIMSDHQYLSQNLPIFSSVQLPGPNQLLNSFSLLDNNYHDDNDIPDHSQLHDLGTNSNHQSHHFQNHESQIHHINPSHNENPLQTSYEIHSTNQSSDQLNILGSSSNSLGSTMRFNQAGVSLPPTIMSTGNSANCHSVTSYSTSSLPDIDTLPDNLQDFELPVVSQASQASLSWAQSQIPNQSNFFKRDLPQNFTSSVQSQIVSISSSYPISLEASLGRQEHLPQLDNSNSVEEFSQNSSSAVGSIPMIRQADESHRSLELELEPIDLPENLQDSSNESHAVIANDNRTDILPEPIPGPSHINDAEVIFHKVTRKSVRVPSGSPHGPEPSQEASNSHGNPTTSNIQMPSFNMNSGLRPMKTRPQGSPPNQRPSLMSYRNPNYRSISPADGVDSTSQINVSDFLNLSQKPLRNMLMATLMREQVARSVVPRQYTEDPDGVSSTSEEPQSNPRLNHGMSFRQADFQRRNSRDFQTVPPIGVQSTDSRENPSVISTLRDEGEDQSNEDSSMPSSSGILTTNDYEPVSEGEDETPVDNHSDSHVYNPGYKVEIIRGDSLVSSGDSMDGLQAEGIYERLVDEEPMQGALPRSEIQLASDVGILETGTVGNVEHAESAPPQEAVSVATTSIYDQADTRPTRNPVELVASEDHAPVLSVAVTIQGQDLYSSEAISSQSIGEIGGRYNVEDVIFEESESASDQHDKLISNSDIIDRNEGNSTPEAKALTCAVEKDVNLAESRSQHDENEADLDQDSKDLDQNIAQVVQIQFHVVNKGSKSEDTEPEAKTMEAESELSSEKLSGTSHLIALKEETVESGFEVHERPLRKSRKRQINAPEDKTPKLPRRTTRTQRRKPSITEENPTNSNKNVEPQVTIEDSQLIFVDGERRWKCLICPKVYTSKHNLVSHILAHNGIKPFCCDICKKFFKQAGHLQQHLLTHGSFKPYICNICDRCFTQGSHLKRHMAIHMEKRPHRCDICNRGFVYPSELKAHVVKHTTGNDYPCETCEKTFTSHKKLKLHMSVSHGDGSDMLTCQECSQVFPYPSQLRDHMIKHTGTRPYQCGECGMEFIKEHHLKSHMFTHTGLKPFVCDLCDRAFNQKANLQRHRLVHQGERSYKCDVCDKMFTQPQVLRSHMVTHAEDKPYQCDICGKKFTRAHNLNGHMHIHKGAKPHVCYCGASFTLKGNLSRHKQVKHKTGDQCTDVEAAHILKDMSTRKYEGGVPANQYEQDDDPSPATKKKRKSQPRKSFVQESPEDEVDNLWGNELPGHTDGTPQQVNIQSPAMDTVASDVISKLMGAMTGEYTPPGAKIRQHDNCMTADGEITFTDMNDQSITASHLLAGETSSGRFEIGVRNGGGIGRGRIQDGRNKK